MTTKAEKAQTRNMLGDDAGSVDLWAYLEGSESGNPHEVALRVTQDDRAAVGEDWAEVYDLASREVWEVRRADCGQSCRCAAVARGIK